MAFVRVEQRNARLAGPVKVEYVNGRDGQVAKGPGLLAEARTGTPAEAAPPLRCSRVGARSLRDWRHAATPPGRPGVARFAH